MGVTFRWTHSLRDTDAGVWSILFWGNTVDCPDPDMRNGPGETIWDILEKVQRRIARDVARITGVREGEACRTVVRSD